MATVKQVEASIHSAVSQAVLSAYGGKRCCLCQHNNGVYRQCCDSLICNICYYRQLVDDKELNSLLSADARDWPCKVLCPKCTVPLAYNVDYEPVQDDCTEAEIRNCRIAACLVWVAIILICIFVRVSVPAPTWMGLHCVKPLGNLVGNMSSLIDWNDAPILHDPQLPWDYSKTVDNFRVRVDPCPDGSNTTTAACYDMPTCIVDQCLYKHSDGAYGWDIKSPSKGGQPTTFKHTDGFEIPPAASTADTVAVVGSTLSDLWALSESGVHSSTCGVTTGNHALRFGGADSRRLVTAPLDVRTGGIWDFMLGYGTGTPGCPPMAYGLVELAYAHDPFSCTLDTHAVVNAWNDLQQLQSYTVTNDAEALPYGKGILQPLAISEGFPAWVKATALNRTVRLPKMKATSLFQYRQPSERPVVLPVIGQQMTNDVMLRTLALYGGLEAANITAPNLNVPIALETAFGDGWMPHVPPPFVLDAGAFSPAGHTVLNWSMVSLLPNARRSTQDLLDYLLWVPIQTFAKSTFLTEAGKLVHARVEIPENAFGPCVRFKWHQPRYWQGYDAWAIDDLKLSTGAAQPGSASLDRAATEHMELGCCFGCRACSSALAQKCGNISGLMPLPPRRCRDMTHEYLLPALCLGGVVAVVGLAFGCCVSCSNAFVGQQPLDMCVICCCRAFSASRKCRCCRRRSAVVAPNVQHRTVKSEMPDPEPLRPPSSSKNKKKPLLVHPKRSSGPTADGLGKLEFGVSFTAPARGAAKNVEAAQESNRPSDTSEEATKPNEETLKAAEAGTQHPIVEEEVELLPSPVQMEKRIPIAARKAIGPLACFFLGNCVVWCPIVYYAWEGTFRDAGKCAALALGLEDEVVVPVWIVFAACCALDLTFFLVTLLGVFGRPLTALLSPCKLSGRHGATWLRLSQKNLPGEDLYKVLQDIGCNIPGGFPVDTSALKLAGVEQAWEGHKLTARLLLPYYVLVCFPFALAYASFETILYDNNAAAVAVCAVALLRVVFGPHLFIHLIWTLWQALMQGLFHGITSLPRKCWSHAVPPEIPSEEDHGESLPPSHDGQAAAPVATGGVDVIVAENEEKRRMKRVISAWCGFRAKRTGCLCGLGGVLAMTICFVVWLIAAALQGVAIRELTAGYSFDALLAAILCIPLALYVFGYVRGVYVTLPACWIVSLGAFSPPLIIQFQRDRSSDFTGWLPCCVCCGERPSLSAAAPIPGLCLANGTPVLDNTARRCGCVSRSRRHFHLRTNPTETCWLILFGLDQSQTRQILEYLKLQNLFQQRYDLEAHAVKAPVQL